MLGSRDTAAIGAVPVLMGLTIQSRQSTQRRAVLEERKSSDGTEESRLGLTVEAGRSGKASPGRRLEQSPGGRCEGPAT